MTVIELVVPVAEAIENQDLLSKFKWAAESKHARKVVAIACTGSAAIGDTRLGLYYGTTKVGQIYNNALGLEIDFADDVRTHSSSLVCAPGDSLALVVEDPPATNDLKIYLDVAEVAAGGVR